MSPYFLMIERFHNKSTVYLPDHGSVSDFIHWAADRRIIIIFSDTDYDIGGLHVGP